MDHFTQSWTNPDKKPDGGVSCGIGFTVSWQRGKPSEAERNGAYLEEVLNCCRQRLDYFQSSQFSCEENRIAIEHIEAAIVALRQRQQRIQGEA